MNIDETINAAAERAEMKSIVEPKPLVIDWSKPGTTADQMSADIFSILSTLTRPVRCNPNTYKDMGDENELA